MRLLVALLIVSASLAGCTSSEDGGFLSVFTRNDTLEGECGHAYNSGWSQQIILKVRLSINASKHVDITDVSISPSHHDGESLDGYDRDRRPDGQGCVAFPLQGEGGYFFLGLAFREGSNRCYVKGQLGGSFDGSFEVAMATMLVEEQGSC